MIRLARTTLAAAALATGLAFAAQGAPDEEALGKSAGYPVGTRTTWFFDERARVGSFSHLDTLYPHGRLAKADRPRPFAAPVSTPGIAYRYRDATATLDDFLDRQRITGLMVLKDGAVLAERYQYDRRPDHRMLSNSMAKTVAALAVGFALAEGRIRSLDDHAAIYNPKLAGVPYGETSIRELLRMSSGVAFSERYDGKDDSARYAGIQAREGTAAALRAFTNRDAPPGTRFSYASIETMVLATVLRGATGQTISEFLTPRL